jgi:hypothetical protein
MRLGDFERERVGEFHRYTAALSDDRGERAYQLLVVGADPRINVTARAVSSGSASAAAAARRAASC